MNKSFNKDLETKQLHQLIERMIFLKILEFQNPYLAQSHIFSPYRGLNYILLK